MIAYMFATCIPAQEKATISKIKNLPDVVEVNGIMGRYDIFVKVASRNERDVYLAIQNIRDVQSVTSTNTFPVIYGQGGTIDSEELSK
ncbi:MAG: Lrp/AsnC ligand binding domain-containing protein [Nitrosopumilaceae archaeon]